jgi:hypothetical protein
VRDSFFKGGVGYFVIPDSVTDQLISLNNKVNKKNKNSFTLE